MFLYLPCLYSAHSSSGRTIPFLIIMFPYCAISLEPHKQRDGYHSYIHTTLNTVRVDILANRSLLSSPILFMFHCHFTGCTNDYRIFIYLLNHANGQIANRVTCNDALRFLQAPCYSFPSHMQWTGHIVTSPSPDSRMFELNPTQ